MKTVIFVTGNQLKLASAQAVAKHFDIKLTNLVADIPEIQSENGEDIVRDKLTKAHQIAGAPVIVSDDYWEFHGLGGFPGPYMKSINHWFSPEIFTGIAQQLTDRRVRLTMRLGYADGTKTQFFTDSRDGLLLTSPRGKSSVACHSVISMDGDDGLSIAEVLELGRPLDQRGPAKVWATFFEWLTTN